MSWFSTFLIALSDLLHEVSEKIKLNPLYAIPLVFLIAAFLFTLVLGVAVFVLPK